ncbi:MULTISPECIES: 5'-methylthioadenosine/adenosylhomocysteine nucleosidase [Psychrilyobacter]|uniref:adenosylhomocysteine nucleosidase n=1 Tax=Psychrilyobacter piezotolerans TaxID=2293438 RepID=A0ABX9KEW0_9FUSO|nr:MULTISPECIES: 5'-methylthioadenosine/adenosylhomocysteine nucleosidase [Psychrilyobacter]MCS5422527.1 5'-methylthioadenosine/adenosylhomocysteine nucleosidase [Psychrilyobacter sp. S5]NDI78733.1 5'-methylthioadenosine/adenosylhomocysteine nucleosidase [Psychrilyobacter piezotolerans]RDE59582.1 5'-methylthioadenosine/adenosylhomocysteine nucleosidase [Psychrilyobacter sp. S5]REI39996.1 5'-methylthioadenosine/adenosylhomocysteine nucleosidase [Psychrilyobacter piezotolerans]
MKRIGIIGAMDIEIELLLGRIELQRKEKIAGFVFHLGKLCGKDVIITSCGVGKVNAASCTQILISKLGVDGIINTGIAGGLHEDVEVCDVVISRDVTHHDVRKKQMKNWFPHQEYFEGDRKLIEAAEKAFENSDVINSSCHLGRIVSGECFVDDTQLKEQIIEGYSPHCVEMEGSAIGHVAHINDVPFVVIRSISDKADEEASVSTKEFEKITAQNSAAVVMNMMKIL